MLRTPRLFALASFVILGAAPLRSAPITASINPAADAMVTTGPSDSDLTDWNYGGAGAMSISGALATKPSVTLEPRRGTFESYLRFNLTPIRQSFDTAFGAGNWTIQSATLRLTQANPMNAIFNDQAAGQFEIHWISNDAWVEGTGNPATATMDGITYDNLPLAGSDVDLGDFQFANAGGQATYTLNLPAAFVADLMSDGSALSSLRVFAANSATSGMAYTFNSRSATGDSANRPLLSIVTVPEPAGVWLALVALLTLLGIARCKLVVGYKCLD